MSINPSAWQSEGIATLAQSGELACKKVDILVPKSNWIEEAASKLRTISGLDQAQEPCDWLSVGLGLVKLGQSHTNTNNLIVPVEADFGDVRHYKFLYRESEEANVTAALNYAWDRVDLGSLTSLRKSVIAHHPDADPHTPPVVSDPACEPDLATYTSDDEPYSFKVLSKFEPCWCQERLGRALLWDMWGRGTAEVRVGLVDTRLRIDHPDLQKANIKQVVFPDAKSAEPYPHATAMASLIVGCDSGNAEQLGMAPGVSMVSVAVTPIGAVCADILADGIREALKANCRIIVVAWGSNQESDDYLSVIKEAEERDCLLFISAGDNYSNQAKYPAAYKHDCVVSVAATGKNDHRAPFSNYHHSVDLAVPGNNVKVAHLNLGGNEGWHRIWSGTSFSAPLAAGVWALYMSHLHRRGNLPESQVALFRRMLEHMPVATVCFDNARMLDPHRLLKFAEANP